MAASSASRKRTPLTAAQKKAAADKRAATMAARKAVPVDEAPTSAAAWKKGAKGEDIRVPSGHVCRLRKIGMREWVKEDIVPDGLRPIIEKAIAKGQGIPAAKIKELSEDTSKWADIFQLMDRVVALVVAKPVVVFHCAKEDDEWVPIPEHERDPETLYTDEIDDEDKAFIFNIAAGGVRDLERFRQQLSGSMGAVRRGEAVGRSTK